MGRYSRHYWAKRYIVWTKWIKFRNWVQSYFNIYVFKTRKGDTYLETSIVVKDRFLRECPIEFLEELEDSIGSTEQKVTLTVTMEYHPNEKLVLVSQEFSNKESVISEWKKITEEWLIENSASVGEVRRTIFSLVWVLDLENRSEQVIKRHFEGKFVPGVISRVRKYQSFFNICRRTSYFLLILIILLFIALSEVCVSDIPTIITYIVSLIVLMLFFC